MKNENKAETIINGYEQANKDAKEVLQYLEKIDDPSQMEESQLPSIVRNLEKVDSKVSKSYIGTASVMGGAVAFAVGTSISSSAFAGGLGMAALGGAGLAGAGAAAAAVPFLGGFVVPAIAVSVSTKLFSDIKIKKYLNDNKETMKKNKAKMDKQRNRLLTWLKTLQERGAKLDTEINEEINKKFSEFKKKSKKMAKDISIQIDDCLNMDTNKRILQYNEVILKQYRLQKDLEEKVEFLFDEYNELLKEKKELERQVNCIIKLLNAMGCPESVINQALN
ncbi:hypothetical protein IV49_GL000720 [Kandleria vitulina DSM 20405]|uniref:Uncharacterized protein n=1 Tax=Kandleria vitulina DSM 20405 TaxID=1410657 RepID=A0A0R2HF60_9FIRM|nr:hypothetical protein [Kandleria vitulina]KRN51256.1 hypothetical protein IV49_GL000720 [Kandleria vitulina DSM 20405]